MADGGHQTERTIVERRQELPSERFSFGRIELRVVLSYGHGLVVCHISFYKRDKPGILLLATGGKDAEDTAICHINSRGAESLGGLCQPREKECTRNYASADV